jgi:Icc-related predicted phosphoesterase
MNIVVVSDIHGDVENMLIYLDKIGELKPNLIICPGDFTDVNSPKGFKQEDVAKLIISELKSLDVPVLAVPGNVDPKAITKIFEKENMSLHGHGKIINGYGFYGYGGAKTPFDTSIEPSDEELETGLLKGYKDVKSAKYKIQITHEPPSETKIDMLNSGAHVGSKTIRSFIEKHQPILAISAHIHEARGIDKINTTTVINSGRFPEGYLALINISNGEIKGRILNLTE